MSEKTAHEVFTTERLNCAQSILKGHKSDFNVTDEMIDDFRAFGGGRAEGNMCGALYAAAHLAESKEAEQHIIDNFRDQTGYTACKELKREGKTSCSECVRIASELLSSSLELS